jgi:hypothetical protein
MPKKETTVFEKINPLARLKRRQCEKSEREWRIAKLGRICPVCAVPLEVSSEEVGNLVMTKLKCPKCRMGWGYAEPIQGANGRSKSGEVDVRRVAELGYRVLDWFELNSKPHEAALVARLLADMLEGVYGVPVDQKTYVQIARGFKIAAMKRYGLRYREESGEPGVMYG